MAEEGESSPSGSATAGPAGAVEPAVAGVTGLRAKVEAGADPATGAPAAFDPPAVAPAADTSAALQRHPLRFTGSGAEYFRIWIVNLLLTILTLGIYSAWAKVRRQQYFHRNTRLDDSVFDYHGRPLAILKGRLIALVLVVAYNVALKYSVALGIVAAALFTAVLPRLLVQSMRFRAYNASWRGLRFAFLGGVREAYLIFGVPIAALAAVAVLTGALAESGESTAAAVAVGGTIGLIYLAGLAAWPWLHWRFKRFQHANLGFGGLRSTYSGRPSTFYGLYLQAVLLLVAAGVLFGGVAGLAALLGLAVSGGDGLGGTAIVVVVALVALYGAALALAPFVSARVQNHVWTRTRLGPVAFDSTVRARRLIGISLGNIALILLTLGLYVPFATVRSYRYRVESVAVLAEPGAGLASFVAEAGGDVGATGEGAADLLDIDFAL